MVQLLTTAVLLMSGFYGLVTLQTAQLPGVAVCTGGVFQGPIEPTRPPVVGDPRNCRAFPTQSRNDVGHGPIPLSWPAQVAKSSPNSQFRRASIPALFNMTGRLRGMPDVARVGASRARHANYHFVGTSTDQPAYTALGGFLQVRDPDLSLSGGHVIATYLWTPDYSYLYQVGWIDEGYGTNYPRVFAESNLPGGCCRYYFDQYPLTVGTKYNFWTVSKPAAKYGLLWWNGTWNELHPVSSSVTREGVMQQFLEILVQFGTAHPSVQTLSNHSSELAYQDAIIQWDASISTTEFESTPYNLTVVDQYHNWEAGS